MMEQSGKVKFFRSSDVPFASKFINPSRTSENNFTNTEKGLSAMRTGSGEAGICGPFVVVWEYCPFAPLLSQRYGKYML